MSTANATCSIELKNVEQSIGLDNPTSGIPSDSQLAVLTTNQLQPKPQVLPWVYIQTQQKINLPPATTINKTAIPQFQIANLNNKNVGFTQIAMPANQVILTQTVKPQRVVLQNQAPVVPLSGSKNTVAYFTMLNKQGKLIDQQNLKKVKPPENMQILVPATTNNGINSHIYKIAPMPKITSNRLPVTSTTNSVQPKLALLPFSIPNKNRQKIFNLKIADGQVQSDLNGAITVMCDSGYNDDKINEVTEIIDLDSPEKNLQDKTYELSITENTNKNDISFTITIPDDTDKTKITVESKHAKDQGKFSKHGVSILKKNFCVDRKCEKSSNLIISPVPNSITTISDVNTKEVKITTNSNFGIEEPVVVTEPKIILQKSERRRKSNFSYRKDYDEVVVTAENGWNEKTCTEKYKHFESSGITVTKLTDSEENNKEMKKLEDLVEIEVIKEQTDFNMNDDYDVSKVLKWQDGIGTLPGSDLKFQVNEFGFLEYITKDEYKTMLEHKLAREKETKPKEFQEEMRCLECGCYGLISEFINPKYCSYDCQEAGNKAAKDLKLKTKKKLKKLKRTNDVVMKEPLEPPKLEPESLQPDEDNTSNENSQDRFNYPWNCSKKGFSWAKYLEHIKAKAAPVKLFKDPFPYNRNGFRPGMKLEGIDPQHPSHYCVLTVSEVIGYRIRLHFDGYSENYDFWGNADTMDIFPVGWCEKYGHTLHPPPGYNVEGFNWNHYLKVTKSTPAPKQLFTNRAGSAICPNGFRIGMKLEAVDRKNTSLVCVATIADMMDNRILVHFDSWDDIYDYWADPTSPYIHPVGWCDQYGHNLTPPNVRKCKELSSDLGYPNPETFTWEKYLKEIKGVAAPVRAFKQRPACGFRRGMRLECVDKRVPQIIRVATVDDVREHQIRISFDGWPDRYSYWVDDDCSNIHPVGWCHKTGHPIEPPLTPDDVYDFLECPTVGCRGQGHTKGSKLSTHSSQKYCPYAEENIDMERVLPDRLLSPDTQLQSVVPVSREPREIKPKPKQGRPPKLPRLENVKEECIVEDDYEEDEIEKPPKRKYRKRHKSDSVDYSKRENSLNGFSSINTDPVWLKHSKYLTQFIKNDSDPRDWSESDVVDFVTSLPTCKDHGALFSKNNIDGEAFLMLTQQDIVDILNIKLGPAIKMYNSILLLRQNVNTMP